MSSEHTRSDRRRNDLEMRIEALRAELSSLEAELERLDDAEQEARTPVHLPLRLDEYKRYGRQMILPGFGLPGARPDLRARESSKPALSVSSAPHRTARPQAWSHPCRWSRRAGLPRDAVSGRSWCR